MRGGGGDSFNTKFFILDTDFCVQGHQGGEGERRSDIVSQVT